MKVPARFSKKTTAVVPPVLFLLLLTNVIAELILQLDSSGVFDGEQLLRGWAFALGGFQPDLNQRPLFPGQSLSMFLTYGFLHTGLCHLVINMFGLFWLGKLVLPYRTAETFFLLYLASMVGAAETYLLIGLQSNVMVGASGALFGLLGVYVIDSGLLNSSQAKPEAAGLKFFRISLVTVALAVSEIFVQMLLGNRPMAWEAHAGGFMTGAVLALLSPPRLPRKV